MLNKKRKASIMYLSLILTILSLFIAYFATGEINAIFFVDFLFLNLSYIIFLFTVSKRKNVSSLLFIAFVTRMVMAIIYTILPDADPDGYQRVAESFINLSLFGFLKSLQTGAYLYSWFIAGIWRITGISTFIIRIINAIISYFCCIKGYDLSLMLFNDKKKSKKTLLFLAFFPTLIRFSSPFASRETLFILFFMLAIDAMYKYYNTNNIKHIFYFTVFVLLGIIIHISAASLFVLLIVVLLKKMKSRKDIFSIFLIILFAIGVVLFMSKNNIGTEKLYLNQGGLDGSKVAWIQESSAAGRAAYLKGFNSSNIFVLILQLPIRIVYFLFTPFPWMIRAVLDVLGFVDATLYLYIITKDLKLFKLNKNSNNKYEFASLILIMLIVMISILASGTSNYGTALRHRAKVIIPLLVLATPFFKNKSDKEVFNR